MPLTDVAVDLYGMPPAGFVAARSERVRQVRGEGDRDLAGRVGALRRPTLGAWAVNLLVRHRAAQVEELLAIGPRLRQAQDARSGEDLRELDRQRHTLTAALREQAHLLAQEAGHPLAPGVDAALDSTLRAAMTDPEAAAAVRSGVLVRDLTSTGFGPVDVEGAVAVPDAPSLTGTTGDGVPDQRRSRPRRMPGPAARRRDPAQEQEQEQELELELELERAREREREQERERARHDVEAADQRAREADAALAAAEATVAEAAGRRSAAAAEVDRLTAELTAAEAGRAAAAAAERTARAARDAASREARTAGARARAAQEHLDALARR